MIRPAMGWFLLASALVASSASARTFYILPDGTGDVPTIQGGADASADGDTLLLGPGVYTGTGNVDVNIGTPCFVISEQGAEATVIDGEGVHAGLIVQWLRLLQGVTFRDARIGLSIYDAATVRDCVFTGCSSAGITGLGGLVTLADSRFIDNGVGAGSVDEAVGCVFRGNGTGLGTSFMSAIIRNNTFENNDLAMGLDGSPTIVENRFVGNGIPGDEGSGVIYVGDIGATITDNYIAGNYGRIVTGASTGVTLERNVIVNNEARIVVMYEGILRLAGNTIAGNRSPAVSLVRANMLQCDVTGNIVAFNVAPAIFESHDVSTTVHGNDIYGNAGDVAAGDVELADNFSLDPWFCCPPEGRFTLQSGSPCLAENSPSGERVGALGSGCDGMQVDPRYSPATLSAQSGGFVTVTLPAPPEVDVSTARLDYFVRPASAGTKAHRATLKFSVGDILEALDDVSAGAVHDLQFTANTPSGLALRAVFQLRIVNDAHEPHDKTSGRPSESEEVRDGIVAVTPNPFNPTTRIRYGLTRPGHVRLVIYDVAGRAVARLVDADQPAGNRAIEWNADGVSSGVYFGRLTTPEGAYTSKLIVLK